ncbi:unnamed protein product [Cladocopium goreaui]|uniref:Heme-binding-like protein At3g10130, chloroplastic n=1 Tax=Cladocopium goreaui TaxID=2562237 RepID=A0A9P1DF95_9DINO|nr:unnamed protein product [Cladocopium goreaui]
MMRRESAAGWLLLAALGWQLTGFVPGPTTPSPNPSPSPRRAVATAEVSAAPAMATTTPWRGVLRRLLLARRQGAREAAFKELAEIYDEVSSEMFAEVEKYALMLEEKPPLQLLRLRPFLGYRSACASLYRTVRDHILPQQAESPVVVLKQSREGEQRLRYVLQSDAMDADARSAAGDGAGPEVSAASKARALYVALRQLVANDVWSVERSANSMDNDWDARTPKLETPKYQVLSRDALSGVEVREYAPYAVVQTQQGPEVANNRSFFMLADYIFGKKNVRSEKMAMTTPVQMDRGSGAMSFIMPSKYWSSLEDAPLPAANAGVSLEERPRETLAVSIFGGYALGPTVAKKTEELIDFLQKSDRWEMVTNSTRLMQRLELWLVKGALKGEASETLYNDPFTVPWKRRNEVSIPVRAKA